MGDRELVVDSDAFVLLSAAGLLERVAVLLGVKPENIRRLPALAAQLQRGRRFKKNYPDAVRNTAMKACERFSGLTGRPADDTTLERLARVEAIDEGEALIFALMTERPTLYLASGDKQAMAALAASAEVADVREALMGRVICMETVLRLLVEHDGVVSTAEAFQTVRPSNTTLRVVFSEVGATDQAQCLQHIDAYYKELVEKVGDDFLYQP